MNNEDGLNIVRKLRSRFNERKDHLTTYNKFAEFVSKSVFPKLFIEPSPVQEYCAKQIYFYRDVFENEAFKGLFNAFHNEVKTVCQKLLETDLDDDFYQKISSLLNFNTVMTKFPHYENDNPCPINLNEESVKKETGLSIPEIWKQEVKSYLIEDNFFEEIKDNFCDDYYWCNRYVTGVSHFLNVSMRCAFNDYKIEKEFMLNQAPIHEFFRKNEPEFIKDYIIILNTIPIDLNKAYEAIELQNKKALKTSSNAIQDSDYFLRSNSIKGFGYRGVRDLDIYFEHLYNVFADIEDNLCISYVEPLQKNTLLSSDSKKKITTNKDTVIGKNHVLRILKSSKPSLILNNIRNNEYECEHPLRDNHSAVISHLYVNRNNTPNSFSRSELAMKYSVTDNTISNYISAINGFCRKAQVVDLITKDHNDNYQVNPKILNN